MRKEMLIALSVYLVSPSLWAQYLFSNHFLVHGSCFCSSSYTSSSPSYLATDPSPKWLLEGPFEMFDHSSLYECFFARVDLCPRTCGYWLSALNFGVDEPKSIQVKSHIHCDSERADWIRVRVSVESTYAIDADGRWREMKRQACQMIPMPSAQQTQVFLTVASLLAFLARVLPMLPKVAPALIGQGPTSLDCEISPGLMAECQIPNTSDRLRISGSEDLLSICPSD